jgi:hypothetical protein
VLATDNLGGQSSVQFYLYTDAAPTDVSVVSEDDNILVFPNPTKGNIKIKGINDLYANLSVYDTLGRKMMETNIDNDKIIELENLPNGVYIFNIKMNNKLTSSKVLVSK